MKKIVDYILRIFQSMFTSGEYDENNDHTNYCNHCNNENTANCSFCE